MDSENKTIGVAGDTPVVRPAVRYEDDGIDLGEYIAILRRNWWKIVLLSLAAGFVTLVVMFRMPDIYQAKAVITPPADEKKQNPALGILASFGVEVGAPTRVEDLETLFKSDDLTARVFRKQNLWQTVLPDRYDAGTGKLKACWTDRLTGREKGPRTPGDWDAIRIAKDRLDVFVNKKTGTVSISFESPSAEGSAGIVKHYLEEGKSRLQEEALDRATMNKKFIAEQIGKTVDALTRDRLYSLYGQEVEREMMARNREQFGFRVIDTPRIPDRKSSPNRFIITLTVVILFLPILSGYYLVLGKGKQ